MRTMVRTLLGLALFLSTSAPAQIIAYERDIFKGTLFSGPWQIAISGSTVGTHTSIQKGTVVAYIHYQCLKAPCPAVPDRYLSFSSTLVKGLPAYRLTGVTPDGAHNMDLYIFPSYLVDNTRGEVDGMWIDRGHIDISVIRQ